MKKLIPLLENSQRDNKWGSVLLGNNSSQPYNIYNYGCLITSFGNYIGMTPAEVNSYKEMFVPGGGDFIWSECGLIGLTQVYASPYYSDAVPASEKTKMKAFINEGRPLIMEIDFNPSTVSEEMHWVLCIGYDDAGEFIILDPWTGTVISLGVYGGISRAMYSYRTYDKTLSFETPEEPDTCQADLVSMTAERDRLNKVIEGKDETISHLGDTITSKNNELTLLQGTVSTLQSSLTNTQASLDVAQEQAKKVPELTKQIDDLTDKIRKRDNEISGLRTDLGTLQKKIDNLEKDCIPEGAISRLVYKLSKFLESLNV